MSAPSGASPRTAPGRFAWAVPPQAWRTPLVWLAFILAHAWVAHVGLVVWDWTLGDLGMYRWWAYMAFIDGHWPVLDYEWVYPAGAIVPMLVAGFAGLADGGQYPLAWLALVSVLDAVAVALLLRRPHGRVAALWFVAFIALLGPAGLGRLDGLVAPLTVVALLVALSRPRLSAALLTAGAWIKVAPGAAVLPLVLAVRRPVRDVVVPALAVCLVVVGTVVARGGGANLLSFVTAQRQRDLQIESILGTPFMVAGIWSTQVVRAYDDQIFTFEISAPGARAVADAATPALLVAVLAVTVLLWRVRRRAGEQFWTDTAVRADFVVRGAFALTLVLLVINKVGSPQFVAWLAPATAVALALGLPRWGVSAWGVLAVAGATQLAYPWMYDNIVDGVPGPTFLLAGRNLAVVALLVVAVRQLVRRPAPAEDAGADEGASAAGEGPAADASGAVRREPGQQVGPGAAVVDRGVG
ncbi:glycosyltransferase 87 family protein [Cellulomonas xiejunii]|uniref:Glycosyltransferase 87 family protein n=1 Tax=Cellulomonas xiejunii TaxID=2968083 RepID=A0ABY5KLY3_9CELL|nr:glycosyltransferase 87 family protein [Cellulomonas xiejunii]MCC2319701.1 glycosyltransferase 87 family protein [Cellulomonas xiejunii]UUI71360.1 glycosyltransferase 87 family protein [Cellulomonas xiejunii]